MTILRKFLAIVGVTAAVFVPMSSSFAYTVHESGSLNLGSCDVNYDSGTYSYTPGGSFSATGPSASRTCS